MATEVRPGRGDDGRVTQHTDVVVVGGGQAGARRRLPLAPPAARLRDPGRRSRAGRGLAAHVGLVAPASPRRSTPRCPAGSRPPKQARLTRMPGAWWTTSPTTRSAMTCPSSTAPAWTPYAVTEMGSCPMPDRAGLRPPAPTAGGSPIQSDPATPTTLSLPGGRSTERVQGPRELVGRDGSCGEDGRGIHPTGQDAEGRQLFQRLVLG